jgi:copper chaperone
MHTYRVDDMTCGHCVRSITRAVHAVDPEAQVRIELARHLVHIESKAAHPFALSRAIREAGYTPGAPDVTHVSAGPGAGSGGCARGGCGCG